MGRTVFDTKIKFLVRKISSLIEGSDEDAERRPLMRWAVSEHDPFYVYDLEPRSRTFPKDSSEVHLRDIYHEALQELRSRKDRISYFDEELLGEPAWQILLDLFCQEFEGKMTSVSSACIASGSPSTTALRYLTLLETKGLLKKQDSFIDKRVKYLSLTGRGQKCLIDYFTQKIVKFGNRPERFRPQTQ